MSNFEFLNAKWPYLAKIGSQAEGYLNSDPNACMLKMRIFGEKLIDIILRALKIDIDESMTQDEKIKLLRKTNINKAIPDLFDIVRRLGNKAVHEGFDDKSKALDCLISMYKAGAWFYINGEII